MGVNKLQPVAQMWPVARFCESVLLEHSHAHLLTDQDFSTSGLLTSWTR